MLHISDLPEELLLATLSFLTPKQCLVMLRVSRLFRRLALDRKLYEPSLVPAFSRDYEFAGQEDHPDDPWLSLSEGMMLCHAAYADFDSAMVATHLKCEPAPVCTPPTLRFGMMLGDNDGRATFLGAELLGIYDRRSKRLGRLVGTLVMDLNADAYLIACCCGPAVTTLVAHHRRPIGVEQATEDFAGFPNLHTFWGWEMRFSAETFTRLFFEMNLTSLVLNRVYIQDAALLALTLLERKDAVSKLVHLEWREARNSTACVIAFHATQFPHLETLDLGAVFVGSASAFANLPPKLTRLRVCLFRPQDLSAIKLLPVLESLTIVCAPDWRSSLPYLPPGWTPVPDPAAFPRLAHLSVMQHPSASPLDWVAPLLTHPAMHLKQLDVSVLVRDRYLIGRPIEALPDVPLSAGDWDMETPRPRDPYGMWRNFRLLLDCRMATVRDWRGSGFDVTASTLKRVDEAEEQDPNARVMMRAVDYRFVRGK